MSKNNDLFLYFRKGGGGSGLLHGGTGLIGGLGVLPGTPGHLQRRYWDTWDDMGTSERSLESSQERVNALRRSFSHKRTQASSSATS